MSTKPSTSLTNKIDIDHWIKHWWSQKNLSCHVDVRDWMIQSYENPLTFWNSLFEYYQKTQKETQSQPLKSYNFYHDCVLKHLNDNADVLKIIQSDQITETYTYCELHQLVEAQTVMWKEKFKTEVGQTIALIVPQGIHFLVGLMTAFRLGLNVCLLPLKDPFLGSDHLLSALKQLSPNYIAAPFPDSNSLGYQWPIIEIDLSIKKHSKQSCPLHTYSAHDVIVKIFDPYRRSIEKITGIDAHTVYACSLRDGMIALSLKSATTWARPLSSMFSQEPFATLTALLAGATIIHIPDHVLQSDPYRLKKEVIEVIEISSSLKTLWTRCPGCPSEKLKLWYKNPLVGSIHEWIAFSESNQLQTVPMANLIIDPGKGGCIVFSQPKPIKDLFLIHPSLGAPWTLLNVNGSGEKALSSYGIFQQQSFSLQNGEANDGYLIIAQMGDDWVIYDTTIPTKDGIPYPIQLVEEAVEHLDFVKRCMMLPYVSMKGRRSPLFILIVFFLPKSRSLIETYRESWSNQIRNTIEQKVGEAFIPDTILFYPLYPKMKQEMIDRSWVQARYESGWFAYQEKKPVYHFLNLLRQSIYEKIMDPMT